MKISCQRDKFSSAFQLVSSVAAARDVKPVLQNVKIHASKNGVLLQATDTEVGIRLQIEGCEVVTNGEAILPTKHLRRILQESTDATLLIESEQDKTLVSGARSRYTLVTQPPDEFPDVEDFADTSYHEVTSGILRELIRRTIFATDTENTKYSLGGVLFEFSDDKIIAVATDGRRLASQEGGAQSINEHQSENSIFPMRALQLVERALEGNDTPVKIAVSKNRALFQTGRTVFFTRLVEGRFPNWRRIIPQIEKRTRIDILAGALFSTVRQAAVVATEKDPGVFFEFESGKLVLKAHGAEVGDSSVEMPISYDGSPLTVKLDPKFMTEFLKVLDAEKNLTLYLTQNEAISILDNEGYSYIVMPLS